MDSSLQTGGFENIGRDGVEKNVAGHNSDEVSTAAQRRVKLPLLDVPTRLNISLLRFGDVNSP